MQRRVAAQRTRSAGLTDTGYGSVASNLLPISRSCPSIGLLGVVPIVRRGLAVDRDDPMGPAPADQVPVRLGGQHAAPPAPVRRDGGGCAVLPAVAVQSPV